MEYSFLLLAIDACVGVNSLNIGTKTSLHDFCYDLCLFGTSGRGDNMKREAISVWKFTLGIGKSS